MATAYEGNALVLSWIHSGGTAILNGDYKTAEYKPSIDLLDQSAGADTNKTYVGHLKDGTWSLSGLIQDGTAVGGTVTLSTLIEGASGTLIVGPEGTAAGKPKITTPCISLGVNQKYQYAGLSEWSVELQQNGARTDGAY